MSKVCNHLPRDLVTLLYRVINDIRSLLSVSIVTTPPPLFFKLSMLLSCSHRNVNVRKTTAQFLSLLAERMGASRLMSGAKDVTERILPTAAQFVTDGGPETRYSI